MWTKKYNPNQRKWVLVRVNGVEQPMMWNSHNHFFSTMAGKTYKMADIDCWLDSSALESINSFEITCNGSNELSAYFPDNLEIEVKDKTLTIKTKQPLDLL